MYLSLMLLWNSIIHVVIGFYLKLDDWSMWCILMYKFLFCSTSNQRFKSYHC